MAIRVWVETDDVLDQLDDDEIRDEYEKRGLGDSDTEEDSQSILLSKLLVELHEPVLRGDAVKINSILSEAIWQVLGKIV